MYRPIQDSLNQLAGTVGRSNQDCINILAGTTANPREQQDAFNIWAGTSGLSRQGAANVKAGTTSNPLSLQGALDTLAFGTFTPASISGLVGWWHTGAGLFQDSGLTTPATANDDPIGGWQDQSGNNRNLLQTTSGRRPLLKTNTLNSRSTILFDGSDDYLTTGAFTFNQPETIYIVFQQVSWASSDTIFDGASGNSMRLYQNLTTPTINMTAGADTNFSTSATIGSYFIVTTIFNGASSILQVNNLTELSGNASTNNAGGFTLGIFGNLVSAPANIQVAEVCLFNTAHGSTDRTSMKNYLASRYNISI